MPRSRRSRNRAISRPVNSKLRGLSESRNTGNVLGARAAVALVVAAEQNRLERNTLANIERADALWRSELVPADGVEIDSDFTNVHGKAAGNLNAVRVKYNAGGSRNRRDFAHRLDDARFRCSRA